MIEFDLEKAKAGAKVQTRSGKAVRLLCFDRKRSDREIVGLIKGSHEREDTCSWSLTGKRYAGSLWHDDNLVMVPEVRYVNLYNDSVDSYYYASSESAATAAMMKPYGYIKTIEVALDD